MENIGIGSGCISSTQEVRNQAKVLAQSLETMVKELIEKLKKTTKSLLQLQAICKPLRLQCELTVRVKVELLSVFLDEGDWWPRVAEVTYLCGKSASHILGNRGLLPLLTQG